MANNLYDKGREKFLGTPGQINWTGHVIKAALLEQAYAGGSALLATHEFYSDVAAYVIGGTSTCKSLLNKTTGRTVDGIYTGGVAGADALTFTAAEANKVLGFILIFRDSDHAGTASPDGPPANPEDSALIALIDSAAGIGITTNGGDITITWDAVNKIFKL